MCAPFKASDRGLRKRAPLSRAVGFVSSSTSYHAGVRQAKSLFLVVQHTSLGEGVNE